jgi:adenylate cyclase
VRRTRSGARLDEDFYKGSPIAVVRETRAPLRVRLTEGDVTYPIARELRDEGGTDYYAVPLPFTNGQVSYASFATRAEGGFAPSALAAIDAIAAPLAQRVELESAYYATRALLDVYLGKNATARVLAGAFRRGTGELIEAAIWFSDMRDFTALTDRTPPNEVIELLDVYFDAVASAVDAHGGEVLKFIGDAVLAIFPFAGAGGARAACRHAVAAADEALAALARANEAGAASGRALVAPIAIGVALHAGSVVYGNIGARARLDFTVIAPSVNEASRLESLSKTLGVPLVMSAAFVAAAGLDDAVDLGEHTLKGVATKQRVFTRRR